MGGTVRLEYEAAVAVITNDNPDKHNAFDDDMDARLFEIFDEIAANPEVRVAIWQGTGKSFSSGRDTEAIQHLQVDLTHHQLMQHEFDGNRKILELDIPIIAAVHGSTIGVSFQRALLCDIRIAAAGTRFRLPETQYGLIPDAGGVARLYQMCGHGLASDLVLTGRTLDAEEALAQGVVSRLVAPDDLDEVARQIASAITKTPAVTVKMARRVIANLGTAQVTASMSEEMIAQTFINKSHDYREMRRALKEERHPTYRGT